MTYPPHSQDPYGAQPDPWGQQPGGWQQPGYPGGGPQHGYPGQEPGYSGGGWQPPEPPKKRTGMIAAIVAAVVLLVGGAVAVTGFWKPGFFLSDEKQTGGTQTTSQPATQAPTGAPTGVPTTAAPPTGETGSPDDAAKIEEIAETVVKGLNEKDAAIVKPVSCSPEAERQEQYDTFPEGITWTVEGSASVTGETATIPIKASSSQGEKSTTLNLQKVNGTWCAASVK